MIYFIMWLIKYTLYNNLEMGDFMKKAIAMILSIIIGGAAGFFGAMYMDSLGGTLMNLLLFVVAVIVAVYLQIIIHEGGHLIFGLLTGYRFVSFRVGNFMVFKKQGKLQFGKYSLAGTGGQCLLSPPELVAGKMPYILYNLGGVLMNIIVALFCTMILIFVNPGIYMSCFCVAMIGIGLLIAVTNGLPIRLGDVDNDGCNTLNMRKSPEALRSLWVQLKINEYMTDGIRLKDMPADWFAMPSDEAMKNGMVASIGVFHCNRLIDEERFCDAGKTIEELLNKKTGMLGLYKMLLTLDLAFCELLGERRQEVLERINQKELIQLMKVMKAFPAVLRTQYAYAVLIEKDSNRADVIKEKFRRIRKNYPYLQEMEAEWKLIEKVDSITNC